MSDIETRLIELRRREPALAVGDYGALGAHGFVLAFMRRYKDRRLLVALNLGREAQNYSITGVSGVILLSTHLDREGDTFRTTIELRPSEGVVCEVN